MKREHELIMTLKERFGKEVFAKTYRIALWDDFVGSKNPKEHGFLSHTANFVDTLIMNNTLPQKTTVKKWDVVVVKFPHGVGTEIAGSRPAIIVNENVSGYDVTVLPLTSASRQKLVDVYDKVVPKDKDNNLFATSHARLRQMRPVSISRLGKFLGTVTNEAVKAEINKGIEQMLATDK